MKRGLDITTKGWSKDNIAKLRKKLIEQDIKYKVKIEMPDLTVKWLYARNPDDVTPYCKQVGATVLTIEDF